MNTQTVETNKKARSVRFNDNALETVVYTSSLMIEDFNDTRCRPLFNTSQSCDDEDTCHEAFQNLCLDRTSDGFHFQRSGSRQSLYDKITTEPWPKVFKKRDSDLDNSNHHSYSYQHCHRQPTEGMKKQPETGCDRNLNKGQIVFL
jgi:hypothetical protein